MRSLVFAFCIVLARGDLRAQAEVWQPAAGCTQVPIWPGAAPDAEPAPEVFQRHGIPLSLELGMMSRDCEGTTQS
jgi:hypothetical protein